MNVATEADQIATGMPGSASSAAATTLAAHWKASVTSWATDVQAHAKRLEDSAVIYESRDAKSREGIAGAGGPR